MKCTYAEQQGRCIDESNEADCTIDDIEKVMYV